MYRYPTNLNKSKMPDASTQTTKGKNIFLLPKKKGFGEAEIHRTYHDDLGDYELTCDECHKDQYPEEYEEQVLCKNQDCSAVKTDEYDKKCQICDGYFMDDGLNDILFIEESPNEKHGSCHLCGCDKNIVRMKKTGEYLCENGCDDSSDEENEEICCKCGTDEEVNQCWECDRYICIDCDSNEMACYGEEDHTYCQLCGEAVLIDEDNFSEDDEYEERKEEAKQYREQVAEEIEYDRKQATDRPAPASAIEADRRAALEVRLQRESLDDEKSKFLYPERCQKYWNVELQKHEWRQYLGAGQFCEPKRIL